MAAPPFNPTRQPRGLPRPLGEHPDGRQLPVPWSQNQEPDSAIPDWGQIDDDRDTSASKHSLCLVCGHTVVKGKVFERTAKTDKDYQLAGGFGTPRNKLQPFYTIVDLRKAIVADGAPLHDRCAKITLAHCTKMRVAVREGFYAERPYFRYAERGGPLGHAIRRFLSTHPELRRKSHAHPLGEHCYVASEAFWHAAGGPQSGLKPYHVKHAGGTHWFLLGEDRLVDLTADQFDDLPPYGAGRGCGFRTRKPSKRAQKVLDFLNSEGRLQP